MHSLAFLFSLFLSLTHSPLDVTAVLAIPCSFYSRFLFPPPTHPSPAYRRPPQGIWKPRKIKNPDYFEEPNPVDRLTPIGAIGLELWTMSENVVFDNFILAEDVASVDK